MALAVSVVEGFSVLAEPWGLIYGRGIMCGFPPAVTGLAIGIALVEAIAGLREGCERRLGKANPVRLGDVDVGRLTAYVWALELSDPGGSPFAHTGVFVGDCG